MIVLDTNVVSETIRAEPDPRVLAWWQASSDDLATTSITVAELVGGVRALPDGRRRDGLESAIDGIIARFRGRILPFDADAAVRYAEFRDARRRAGRPLSVEDGMIAAICSATSSRLATRNTRDFADLALDVVDPWAI